MQHSSLGFGTYRVTFKNPNHQKALLHAINSGISLIDTSSNYMGGEAEILIGNLISEKSIDPDQVTIVTKGGYIQGELLSQHLQGSLDIKEVVPYSRNCYHSIHPEFLLHQISASKKRLQLQSIDIYLLHNPEYYLMTYLNKPGILQEEIRQEMQKRIQSAFIALEQSVQNGDIKSYGISSNSFAKPADDPLFLEYKNLLHYAQNAALKVGFASHHFTTVQLPYNLLEKKGEAILVWAKNRHLQTLINRPFNAFDKQGMQRLISYDKPKNYDTIFSEIIQNLDNYSRSDLRGVLEDLNNMRMKFKTLAEAEHTLYKKALPFLKQIIQEINNQEVQVAVREIINPFFTLYLQEVKYYLTQTTKSYLRLIGVNITQDLQDEALRQYLDHSAIDTVLIGMRESTYVDNILSIKTLS
jgi:aryl-alcohol dehydrogenase-like predicted oxidoreductase